MISYDKALKILNKSKLFIKSEKILVKNSLNRVCSKNIYSKFNYPAANNTALDGFAIKSKDNIKLKKNKKLKFLILKTISAGDNPKIKKVTRFSAIEVMTGAVIPQPFDVIIPIENARLFKTKKGRYIVIDKIFKKNQFIRFKGSDYKKGDIIIKKGELINSSHILALKTLGIKQIDVKKKIRIKFYTTGNEITNKINIPSWKIRSSNNFYIKSYIHNFPVIFSENKILKDKDSHLFRKEINKNLKNNTDIIITSGGISAGKHDFIPNVIKKFKSKLSFKGVLIRPGKPMMFTHLNKKKSFFGLPGNSISSAACFHFFVKPYLFISLGIKNYDKIEAHLENKFFKKKNFTRFLKGRLFKNNNIIKFKVLSGQESFKIKSFVKSNSWGIFPDGKSLFKKNDKIKCTGLSILGDINFN